MGRKFTVLLICLGVFLSIIGLGISSIEGYIKEDDDVVLTEYSDKLEIVWHDAIGPDKGDYKVTVNRIDMIQRFFDSFSSYINYLFACASGFLIFISNKLLNLEE